MRGNHDAVFDWKREIELTAKYDKWYMPSLYYKEEFEIGNGKRLGVLFVDSSLMLCSNFTYSNSQLTADDHHRLKDMVCGDPFITEWGNN